MTALQVFCLRMKFLRVPDYPKVHSIAFPGLKEELSTICNKFCNSIYLFNYKSKSPFSVAFGSSDKIGSCSFG